MRCCQKDVGVRVSSFVLSWRTERESNRSTHDSGSNGVRVRVILYLDGKFDSADSGRSRIRRTDAPFRGLSRDSNPRH